MRRHTVSNPVRAPHPGGGAFGYGLPPFEEHVDSLKKYPPIPNGAQDPYSPE